jgi:hypothetical protein
MAVIAVRARFTFEALLIHVFVVARKRKYADEWPITRASVGRETLSSSMRKGWHPAQFRYAFLCNKKYMGDFPAKREFLKRRAGR